MSNTEYKFDGLDEWEKRLVQAIESQYPAEFREMVIKLARELQKEVNCMKQRREVIKMLELYIKLVKAGKRTIDSIYC